MDALSGSGVPVLADRGNGGGLKEQAVAVSSEFLKSGNKLLSLRSMDTTSLASALFVLALAKNSTRQETKSSK